MPVYIEAGKLGARIRSDQNGIPRVLKNAMFSAGQRGKAFIVGKTPVDRGILRNAWIVVKLSDGVEIVNDQPYAGIMEAGARPFKMSKAGREALEAWVKRKILRSNINVIKHGVDTRHMHWKDARKAQLEHRRKGKAYKVQALWQVDEEAKQVAWAIAKNFEKYGMKGKRFVYMNLPKLAELMDAEINRYLDKFFNRPLWS